MSAEAGSSISSVRSVDNDESVERINYTIRPPGSIKFLGKCGMLPRSWTENLHLSDVGLQANTEEDINALLERKSTQCEVLEHQNINLQKEIAAKNTELISLQSNLNALSLHVKTAEENANKQYVRLKQQQDENQRLTDIVEQLEIDKNTLVSRLEDEIEISTNRAAEVERSDQALSDAYIKLQTCEESNRKLHLCLEDAKASIHLIVDENKRHRSAEETAAAAVITIQEELNSKWTELNKANDKMTQLKLSCEQLRHQQLNMEKMFLENRSELKELGVLYREVTCEKDGLLDEVELLRNTLEEYETYVEQSQSDLVKLRDLLSNVHVKVDNNDNCIQQSDESDTHDAILERLNGQCALMREDVTPPNTGLSRNLQKSYAERIGGFFQLWQNVQGNKGKQSFSKKAQVKQEESRIVSKAECRFMTGNENSEEITAGGDINLSLGKRTTKSPNITSYKYKMGSNMNRNISSRVQKMTPVPCVIHLSEGNESDTSEN